MLGPSLCAIAAPVPSVVAARAASASVLRVFIAELLILIVGVLPLDGGTMRISSAWSRIALASKWWFARFGLWRNPEIDFCAERISKVRKISRHSITVEAILP